MGDTLSSHFEPKKIDRVGRRGQKQPKLAYICTFNAQVDEIPDVEGAAVGGDDDEEDAEEGEDYESDDEEIYWFDCPFCKKNIKD